MRRWRRCSIGPQLGPDLAYLGYRAPGASYKLPAVSPTQFLLIKATIQSRSSRIDVVYQSQLRVSVVKSHHPYRLPLRSSF